MSSVKVYQDEQHSEYAAGRSKYLHGKKVGIGEVLRVTHISGYFDNIGNAEEIQFGYYNGHTYVEIDKADPDANDVPVHWKGNLWLRENQYIFIYCNDVAAGEVMRLRAEGRYY